MKDTNKDFLFASKVVELAEEKDYLTLKNRVFFFNSPNLNSVQINYDDSSLEQCKSLINCPLLAKYIKRNGQDDLGGHEVSVNNGQVEFNTAAIGTITDIEIVEEDVETVDGSVQKLPCLYATEVVWSRFKNATNAIRRLYNAGQLHNSWELKSGEYSYSNGVKTIKSYTFIGNCLLGTESYPAYGRSARILDMSSDYSEQYEYLAAESFSEALALDLESAAASNINQLDDTNRKEGLSMDVNENVTVDTSEEEVKEETVEVVEAEETVETETNEEANSEVAEVSEDDPVEESTTEDGVESAESAESENTESSSMKTVNDIRKMVRVALNEENTEDYMDVAYIFPEEKIVLVQSWRMNELEYIQYSYRIDGDKVTLDNKKNVEMTVSPLRINSEIESKNSAIAEANQRIVELENQNAELQKAKEELDKIQAEHAEAERAEAVNKLREYVVKSGRFTEEEIASEDIQKAINELNETWLKAEIADRLVASLADDKSKKVETSETKQVDSTLSIVLSEEEASVTADAVMSAFFN